MFNATRSFFNAPWPKEKDEESHDSKKEAEEEMKRELAEYLSH